MRSAALVAIAIVALGTRASAQSSAPPAPIVPLTWSAPDECPDRDAVLANVGRYLARPLAPTDIANLTLDAHVTHTSQWRVDLSIVSASGTASRTLEARTCAQLADATALILALAIAPDDSAPSGASATAASASSSPPPNVASEAPSSAPTEHSAAPETSPQPLDTERPESPPPARAPQQPYPPSFDVGAGVLTDIGILPGAGAGAEARVGFSLGPLRMAVRADEWPTRVAHSLAGDLAVDLQSLGLETCVATAAPQIEVRECAAIDVGSMGGTIQGQGGRALWSAAFLQLGFAWRPSRWFSARLDLAPGLTLAAPHFLTAGTQSPYAVYTPATIVVRAGLVVELHL